MFHFARSIFPLGATTDYSVRPKTYRPAKVLIFEDLNTMNDILISELLWVFHFAGSTFPLGATTQVTLTADFEIHRILT